DTEICTGPAERVASRQPADIDLADIGDPFAVYLEGGDGTGRMIEENALGHVGAAGLDGDGEIPFRADRETLGGIPDRHMVDDPRRVGFEVDHADRVGIAVRAPAVAGVCGQRELSVRAYRNVVGEDPGRQV